MWCGKIEWRGEQKNARESTWKRWPKLSFCWYFRFYQTGWYYIALAGLELAIQTGLASNSEIRKSLYSECSAGIKGVCHHAWPELNFYYFIICICLFILWGNQRTNFWRMFSPSTFVSFSTELSFKEWLQSQWGWPESSGGEGSCFESLVT